MDDAGFHFSSNLARHCDPSKIICTTNLSRSDVYDAALKDARKFWELSHPDETIISSGKNQIPWFDVKCILWFPRFASSKENLVIEKLLLQNFFDLLAVRMLATALHGVRVILTMNNIRFSQLQVIVPSIWIWKFCSWLKLVLRITNLHRMILSTLRINSHDFAFSFPRKPGNGDIFLTYK